MSKPLAELQKIAVEIRRGIKPKVNLKRALYGVLLDELHNFEFKPVKEYQFAFTSRGCAKGLGPQGPCTMCGFLAETTMGKQVSAENYIAQFKRELAKPDFKQAEILSMFNAGSLLNEWEFPRKARLEIFRLIAKCEQIKIVIFESRPEFVTREKLLEIKKALPGKRAILTLGIEAVTDIVREQFINKGITKSDIERVVRLAKEMGIGLHAYVLLKPPFLTEAEAIKEAIKTIKYTKTLGIDGGVTLEICVVPTGSLLTWMHRHGLYKPPWLWSAIEVLKRTKRPKQHIRLGTGGYTAPDVREPRNCPKCTPKVLNRIYRYNASQSLDLFKGLSCSCQKRWQAELEITDIPFEERIPRFLRLYAQRKGA